MTRPAPFWWWSMTKTNTACGRPSPTFRRGGGRSSVKPVVRRAWPMSRSTGPTSGPRASARRWTADGTRIPGRDAAGLRRSRPHRDGDRNRADRSTFRARADGIRDLVRRGAGRTRGVVAVLVSRPGWVEDRIPARLHDFRGRRARRPLRGRYRAARPGRPRVVVGAHGETRRDDRRDVADGRVAFRRTR